ncbi:MAG: DUF302 domain-containing protein [Ardenticatenaceae bacterium]|nr:DUF302 domain-containing protein [Ardenticatenaceae bacterium]
MEHHNYGFTIKTPLSDEAAIGAVTEALKAEGFGVLTEIDVQAVLKKKLDVEVAPYKILGACNPSLSHRVLAAEPEVGLLLPCNVTVYRDEAGHTTVSAIDALAMFSVIQRPDLEPVAREVSARLRRALETLPTLEQAGEPA